MPLALFEMQPCSRPRPFRSLLDTGLWAWRRARPSHPAPPRGRRSDRRLNDACRWPNSKVSRGYHTKVPGGKIHCGCVQRGASDAAARADSFAASRGKTFARCPRRSYGGPRPRATATHRCSAWCRRRSGPSPGRYLCTAPTISDANRMLSAGITFEQQIDAGLVIDAGVEVDVVPHNSSSGGRFMSCASPR